MKNMKMLQVLLVSILSLTILVGCSPKNAAAEEPVADSKSTEATATEVKEVKEEVKTEEPVSLRFSIWNKDQLAGMEAIVAAYQVEHPNVTINVEVVPWGEYWTKLEAGAVGNSMPDILWMHSNEFYKYASNGKLLEVTSDMIDTTKYPQGIVKNFSYDEKLYGVPKDFDTIGLIYNKNLFDAAGVAYPDETWTWDTFKEAAIKLTDKEKGVTGFAASFENQIGYYNTIYQNGGTVITQDHKSGFGLPETREGVKFYFDFYKELEASESIDYYTENSIENAFASDKVAMTFRGSWLLNYYSTTDTTKDKFDIAVLPQGKVRASIYNGLTYAGSVGTKYPEVVKDFLAFCGSKEANIIQGENRAAIPAYENTQDSFLAQFDGINVKAYIDMLEYAVVLPFTPNKPKWEDIEKTTLRAYAIGDLTDDEAFGYIEEEVNKVLDKE